MRKLTHSASGTLLIMVCAVSLIAAGQPQNGNRKRSGKAAWEWTLEERIAVRTDAAAAKERVREPGMSAPVPATQASAPELGVIADAFDGTTHPELFLPYQVFDQLIGIAFPTNARSGRLNREGFMPEVERLGLPADFWDRLEILSTIFIADRREVWDAVAAVGRLSGAERKRAEEALALKHIDICRSRADALTAARNEFGQERFDRFLYEVIAVNMFTVADRLPDPARLRQLAEGCR